MQNMCYTHRETQHNITYHNLHNTTLRHRNSQDNTITHRINIRQRNPTKHNRAQRTGHSTTLHNQRATT